VKNLLNAHYAPNDALEKIYIGSLFKDNTEHPPKTYENNGKERL